MSDWLKVPCPTCGALASELCIRIRRRVRFLSHKPHAARVAAARFVRMPVEPTFEQWSDFNYSDPVINFDQFVLAYKAMVAGMRK